VVGQKHKKLFSNLCKCLNSLKQKELRRKIRRKIMKRKLIYGIFAMIFGIGLSVANVSATSYDPTGNPGSLPNTPQTPMILNHGMVGDALLGEFYRAMVDDTIGGVGPVEFATYISIENVTGNWVAAHVRLRSGRYSVEVIDFPILLSPHDVFWFQFEAISSGVPGDPSAVTIVSTDVDTILKSGLDELAGPGGWDGTKLTLTLTTSLLDDFDKLDAEYKKVKEFSQGYIEVFGLFSLTFTGSDTVNADHNFFDIMSQLWDDAVGVIVGTDPQMRPAYRWDPAAIPVPALDVEKVLTGHVFIGDFTNGLYTGYTMKAIKDFRSPAIRTPAAPATSTDRRDFYIRGLNNAGGLAIRPATILYNWIGDIAYREPDWATSFGPTWNDGDNLMGAAPVSPVDSFSLDEVEDALVKQTLIGTYFNTGFSGNTYTIATVTAPTKYLHHFFAEGSAIIPGTVHSGLAGTGVTQWPVGIPGIANSVRSLIDIEKYVGKLAIFGAVWNQKQASPKGPSPYVATELPWELNVIPVGEGTHLALSDFCFLMITDLHSPFVEGVTTADWPAGYWSMSDFQLQGILGGDPRNTIQVGLVEGYDRTPFGLLGALEAAPNNLGNILPVSGQIMDFDFTNFPHARMIDPSWDNPTWPDQD
jgi:hypothetical protein